MALQVIKHILLSFALVLMHSILVSLFEIRGIAPDFTLIWLSLLCLQYRRNSAIIWGFMIGLLMDLTGGEMLGLHAFSLSVAGYVGSLISGIPQQGKPFSIRITMIVSLSLLNSMIPLLFRAIYAEAGLGAHLLRTGLPAFVYALIAGLIVHGLDSLLEIRRRDACN